MKRNIFKPTIRGNTVNMTVEMSKILYCDIVKSQKNLGHSWQELKNGGKICSHIYCISCRAKLR